jgi:hypothetical protein
MSVIVSPLFLSFLTPLPSHINKKGQYSYVLVVAYGLGPNIQTRENLSPLVSGNLVLGVLN